MISNPLLFSYLIGCLVFLTSSSSNHHCKDFHALNFKTTTPVKYLVIIYPENASFDHFFGTYPHALNPKGQPKFKPKPFTPTVNGLSNALLTLNQNLTNPFRLDRSQAATCRPAHSYTLLQTAAHAGLLDHFEEVNPLCANVMGYFDGNTVTALWNYAQRFAMSDNFHSTTFTPSTPGHINLISGQTHGAIPTDLAPFTTAGTLIDDADPAFDDCSEIATVALTGLNVGNLLNAKKITWGYFQGGFADCAQTHLGSEGVYVKDYIPHHAPFQYYQSTSNPGHLPPSSIEMIGFQDQANHLYDLKDFWAAAKNHQIPAVSFLKPPAYQDGHPGYSDPLALQTFLVKTINILQQLPEWPYMAIFIAWDDSGGWYDHAMSPIINDSQTSYDNLVSPGNSGDRPPMGGYQGRLGYGLRVPCLLISPFAKINYVDHTVTDQTSLLKFMEDNWHLGRIGDFSFDEQAGTLFNLFDFKNPHYKPLLLNSKTGLIIKKKD